MKKKILVVIDMQNDFITGPLGNDDCVKVVDKVADLIENGGYDRFCVTLDTHNENYLETNEGKHLPVKHCIKETPGRNLNKKVADSIRETRQKCNTFTKNTFGSLNMSVWFHKMKYEPEISDLTIDICGVCTGICVISNAMLIKAALPEAKIRVIADACACITSESHKTALEAMKMCQIEIIK